MSGFTGFDPARFFRAGLGHGGALGIQYHAHGADWAELALPYDAKLAAHSGAFVAHATLDLRVDYLRPATPGKTVIGRGECYRLTRSIAFVRGQAHDGDPGDPLAHVAGTFMAPEGYPR